MDMDQEQSANSFPGLRLSNVNCQLDLLPTDY